MIKKIIGIVASLAILALIVFTALGAGTYKSMLPEGLFSRSTAVESLEPTVNVDAAADATQPVVDVEEQITE